MKELLLRLIKENKQLPTRTIKANKELVNWINEQCPELQESKYDIATKVYWIVNNIHDWNDPRVCCSNELCRKPLYRNIKMFKYGYDGLHCCIKCSQKDPKVREHYKNEMMKKYGVENSFQAEEVKEKMKQTSLRKYGTKYTTQVKEFKDKIKKTNLERYGNEHPFGFETEHFKNIIKERYGVDNISQSEIIKERKKNTLNKHIEENSDFKLNAQNKTKETSLKHFGVDSVLKSPIIKEKIKQSNLKNHGVEYPMQSEEIKRKSEQTCLKHFGVKFPAQSHIIRSKQQSKYYYDNKYFDSGWEIIYYIYLTDNNIRFEYQPHVTFKYKDINQKEHVYVPDFLLLDTNEIIELKGDNNFTKDGKMINPRKRDFETDFQFEAKHQCMLENGVKICKYNEMLPIFQWFENKYKTPHKEFVRQFRPKKDF